MVDAPLLTFLRYTLVEQLHPIAIQTMNHRLAQRIAGAQNGYPRYNRGYRCQVSTHLSVEYGF